MRNLLFAIFLTLAQTQLVSHLYMREDLTIVRRGDFIIAATTDGYLCYGTRTPLAASCHRAVPEVTYAGE